jgi:uncharacterized repeat protein (TIGR03847 family)
MDSDFGFSITPSWVERFRAEALGEPGQRRFRLVVVVAGETLVIWMEKQQMQALGLAIGQILEQANPAAAPLFEASEGSGIIEDDTPNQFRLGRIELGVVEEDGSILINAFDIQEDAESKGMSMRFRPSQARALVTEAASLAAAGRPFCPMCGQPMDPSGHVCPEQNGLLPLPIDELYLVDDDES